MRKLYPVLIAAMSAAAIAGNASAAVNLVTNGGFEANAGGGQLGFNTSVTGWSTTVSPEYAFVFNAGGGGVSGTTADTTGVPAQLGVLRLWGPGDGSNNGLDLSPDGGAFVGLDPVFENGSIQQNIAGLSVGSKYEVTFNWAVAQQWPNSSSDTPTFAGWNVSLGGATQTTGTLNIANHGFSGWQTSTLDFVYDGTTPVLNFMAVGGPALAQPPFALLDGVSMISVPEPTTWALMIMGFGGVGAMVRSRRRQAALA